MFIVHCLDDIDTLDISGAAKTELIQHLLLPFTNKKQAVEFWRENRVRLFVLSRYEEIEFSEYRVVLDSGYTVQLKMVSEQGYYYVMPAVES